MGRKKQTEKILKGMVWFRLSRFVPVMQQPMPLRSALILCCLVTEMASSLDQKMG